MSRDAIFDQVKQYPMASVDEQPGHKHLFFEHLKGFRRVLREGAKLPGPATAGFCRNLLRDWPCLWHFVRYPGVDSTNNRGERSLRHESVTICGHKILCGK